MCRLKVLLCVALSFLSAVPVLAQATSSLRGKVIDAQGQTIPGVAMMLVNEQTGFQREIVSDESGNYQAVQVPPGTYKLNAQLEGFATYSGTVTLAVNTPATLDVTMELATLSESVQVQADLPFINTVDATVGNAFNETQVRQLPLLTRNVVELLSLQPGVTPTGEVVGARRDQNNIMLDGVDVNDNQTAGLESALGSASQPGMNFNNNGIFRESGFNAALPVPLDSVQEFRVTVTGQNANQGRSSGGQVTLVTKSGTNQFHGSGYEYHRNHATSANNFFNNRSGLPVEKLIRNQYGASLGGPIIRNRLFFFGNFEQRKDDSGRSVLRRVPSDTLREGVIMARANNGQVYRLDANAIKAIDPLGIGPNQMMLGLFSDLPVSNDPSAGVDGGLNFGGYRFNAPVTLDNKAYVVKTDIKLDEQSAHNLSLRTTIADNANDELLAQYPGQDPVARQINKSWGLSASYTGVLSPNLVNVFNFGLTTIDISRTGTMGVGLGHDSIDSIQDYGNSARPFARLAPTYNFTNDLTWNKGSHSMTIGANIRFVRNERTSWSNAFPSISFGRGNLNGLGGDIVAATNRYLQALTGNPNIAVSDPTNIGRAFGNLLGLVSSGTQTMIYDRSGNPLAVGDPTVRNFASNEYEFYFGDSWRMRPNLTLAYGVRYMVLGVPYETDGMQVAPTFPLQDFREERIAGMLAGTPSNQLPHDIQTYDFNGSANGKDGWYKSDLNNFAPRVSVAYSPTEGFLGKLLGDNGVIRAGAGLVYDRFGSDLVTKFDGNASFGLSEIVRLGPSENFTTSRRYTGTLPSMPVPPSHTFPFTPPPIDFIGGAYMGIATDLHAPYNFNMNVSVARELPGGLTVEVGYIGRKGRDILMQVDATGGWGIHFRDPASGQSWYEMSQIMRDYWWSAGLTPQMVRANPNLIAPVPFIESMYPGLANLYFPGSASANYFDLLHNQMSHSDSDATHQVDRIRSARFPNCIVKTGCYTLFATQSSGLSMWTNAGYSNFHGGTLSLRKAFRQGVSFDFNYTLAHSMDNGIAPEAGGGTGGGIMLDPYNWDAYYGDSDFDIRHNINSNVLVDLPFGEGKPFLSGGGGLLEALVGGWQVSGIFRYRSGLPTSVAYSGIWQTNWSFTSLADPMGDYEAEVQTNARGNPALFPTTNASAANWSPMRAGNTGMRAAVRLDDFYNTDLAVTKSFRLPYSTHRLQFRAEAFNFFNNVNFTNVALDANSPNTFGEFTAAAPARVWQFALRYEF
jgi:hypothetical protein